MATVNFFSPFSMDRTKIERNFKITLKWFSIHCADCEAQMLKWTAACQAFARKSPSSDCRSHRYIASIDCPNDAGSAKTRIQPRKKQETKQTRKKTATLGGNDDDGQGRDANSRGSMVIFADNSV